MPRITPTGEQDYATLVEKNSFYIDKTYFIKDWWESCDAVTLITRPHRFGKTLTMSMLKYFFSVKYADRADLFQGKKIWQYEKYRALQGTYPVISLTFSDIKDSNFEDARKRIAEKIIDQYSNYDFLKNEECLSDIDKKYFAEIDIDMDNCTAKTSLKNLSHFLFLYYKKKPIILIDEYDIPIQPAWKYNYRDEIRDFFNNFFLSTFKANEYLERAIITGVTDLLDDPVFCDVNIIKAAGVTSEDYCDSFGFTQNEIKQILAEYHKSEAEEKEIKRWFGGYTFGSEQIYNPASIAEYLQRNEFKLYWDNAGSNSFVSDVIRLAGYGFKSDLEILLNGDTISETIDGRWNYSYLYGSERAGCCLLFDSGFLHTTSKNGEEYALQLTNQEVTLELIRLIKNWFAKYNSEWENFLNALCTGDLKKMNLYLSKITENTFGTFDVTGTEPERFYHGFVIGLLAAFWGRYHVSSNRESGIGRYDVLLKPLDKEQDDPIILEFKVDRRKRFSLKKTVAEAHKQIEEKHYAQILVGEGFDENRIRKYGIAFHEKKVLVG